jgi:hypothetical protein
LQKSLTANLQEPIDEKKPFTINRNENESSAKAGKQFNVSGRTVASAKVIKEHGTESEIEAAEYHVKEARERQRAAGTKHTGNQYTQKVEVQACNKRLKEPGRPHQGRKVTFSGRGPYR